MRGRLNVRSTLVDVEPTKTDLSFVNMPPGHVESTEGTGSGTGSGTSGVSAIAFRIFASTVSNAPGSLRPRRASSHWCSPPSRRTRRTSCAPGAGDRAKKSRIELEDCAFLFTYLWFERRTRSGLRLVTLWPVRCFICVASDMYCS